MINTLKRNGMIGINILMIYDWLPADKVVVDLLIKEL